MNILEFIVELIGNLAFPIVLTIIYLVSVVLTFVLVKIVKKKKG